jgi:hypothetical protein
MADDSGLTPELIQALADAGLLDHYLGLDSYPLARAKEKAATPMPEGQVYGPGYQAPHWLNYVNTAMLRGQGRSEEANVQKLMAGRLRDYGQTAARYAESKQVPPPPPMIPPLLRRPKPSPEWNPSIVTGQEG